MYFEVWKVNKLRQIWAEKETYVRIGHLFFLNSLQLLEEGMSLVCPWKIKNFRVQMDIWVI